MNFIDEALDILEAAMDGCIAEVSDLIEFAQFFQYLIADSSGGNLAAACFDFMHDIVDRLLEGHEADRPFLAGLRHAVGQLAAIENFMLAVAFDHAQIAPFNFFVSGKAESTGEANS